MLPFEYKNPRGDQTHTLELEKNSQLKSPGIETFHDEHHDLHEMHDFNHNPSIHTANSGPIGLLGFGLTTFLLSLANAGAYEVNTMVLAMGIAFGGTAQLIAGLFEWYRGKMFTAVAFVSYGTFWWSFVLLHVMVSSNLKAPDNISMGCYLFIWGIFSLGMLVASFRKPIVVRCIFSTLVVTFMLLATEHWAENKMCGKAAGVFGTACALFAVYAGCGEIINETYGKTILPLGE